MKRRQQYKALARGCRFEDDLRLARDLGSNAFRFSLEWSRIVPERGQVSAPAIQRYHKMIDCMIRRALLYRYQ